MIEKGKEFWEKDLLELHNIEVQNNILAEKILQKKIINRIKKSKQYQHTFHYLTCHSGKGIRDNIKRLYEINSNNKIINIYLDKHSIKEKIIEYNTKYF